MVRAYSDNQLTGKVFGEWTVTGLRSKDKNMKNTMWNCTCSCGITRLVSEANLKRGASKSCGHNQKLKPYEALYNHFVHSATKKKQKVSLSYEDFVYFTHTKHCEYCDRPINWSKHFLRENGYRYNLDRKDNGQGYTKKNCVVCCWFCNDVKGNRFTYEQMKEIGILLYEWRQLGKGLQ